MNRIHPEGDHMAAAPAVERTKRGELAKQARREEILSAARSVFAERGFGGTTIADIAEEANIALGTIYLYFASKEDVFAALNEKLIRLITDAVTNVPPAESLEDDVRARIDNVFAACAANRDLVRLAVLNTDPGSAATRRIRMAEESRNDPMVRGLERAMAAGTIREADPCIMTKLTYGFVSIAVYQAFVLSDGSDTDKYRQACGDMIIAYMSPQGAGNT
jgi:AcrR family transcriptional regulator